MNIPSQKSKRKSTAQAMVEFALALPILLLVVYGLLETGRLLFMYASVVTAARQAARYGSASGDNGSGTNYYSDCDGIRAAANRVAFIQRFTSIKIYWDTGPGSTSTQYCNPNDLNWGSDNPVNGDRILVSVTSHFSPIVPLVPFQGFDITSTDSRTLLITAYIAVTPIPGGLSGGSALALGKAAQGPNSSDPLKYYAAGDVITYTYTLQNVGTSALAGQFTVTDNKLGSFKCGPASLAGGASATCTRTYTITDADVAAGSVTNIATAADAGNSVLSNSATATVTLGAQPAITLAKTGVAPNTIAAGQLIQYSFVITNTGNAPLTPPYTILDPLIGSNWNCGANPPNPLAIGGTVTCTGTYALKNSDISNGAVTNTAVATAKSIIGTVTSPQAKATVLTPPLFLDLTVSPGSVTAPGQPVTYTYTFTNRTTSAMKNITVTDTRGANALACVASLAGGASGSCTHTYTVTQADFDSPTGYFSNTASGTAQGNINSNVAGVNVTLAQGPSITLTKTASPTLTGPGTFFSAGQTITYTYAVYNAGNVTITPSVATPLKVTDSDPRVVMSPACTVTSGSIAPKASLVPACTGLLILQDSDAAAGSVTSTGTVNAMFGSTALTATSTYTLKTFWDARVSVIKTPGQSYFTQAGNTITYSFSIQNTGGIAPLLIGPAYTLSDQLPDKTTVAVTCPNTAGKTLALGASIACNTFTYTVTAADAKAGFVDNTASITAGSTTPTSTNVAGTAHVTQLICDGSHPTSVSLNPIPDGSNTSWDILNNTGTNLHFAIPSGMSITWSGGNLQQILLGGISVWSGNQVPNGTISLTTTGWPAIPYSGGPTVTTMAFKFSAQATGIKVVLTFQEKAGNQCTLTSP